MKVLNTEDLGENWLRDHFHIYLKKNLSKIADIRYKYNQFVSLCRSFEDTMKYARKQPKVEKNYKNYSTFDEEIKEQSDIAMKVPEFDESLAEIPLIPLIHKTHFRYFL